MVLVVARLVQGVCAALLFPQVLSLLNVTYTGNDRARAFRIYGVVLGLATAFGQVLGGALIRANLFGLDWRTCFLINIPIGLLTLALTPAWVTESRSANTKRIDSRGAVLVTLALVLLVFPLIEGRQAGWPLWSILSMIASVPMFWVFLRYQDNVVEPVLLRTKAFLTGVGTVLATYAGMASFFLVLAVFLQDGKGYSPLASGIAFLPVGLAFLLTSLLGAPIARHLGRNSISIGAVLMAVSEAALALVAGTTGAGTALIAPLVAVGCAMGVVMTPLISRVLSGIHPDHAGSASGVLSTMQQVGNSLGVALIGIVFYGALNAGVSYAYAFQFGMGYTALMALLVALLTYRTSTRSSAVSDSAKTPSAQP
jgi:predicted MFS family arabinose efflux permease